LQRSRGKRVPPMRKKMPRTLVLGMASRPSILDLCL
jgi:hypothetical protein